MSNKFQSADSFKFKHTLTGASGHFDVLFLHDGLGWPDSKPRLISGYDDNIYHYGKRLLKEGDVAGMSSSTSVTSESTSGIKINAYQANLFSTGDLVRYDIDTNFYVKSIASAKSTSDVVGVVDLISGTHDFLKDSSDNNREVKEYFTIANGVTVADTPVGKVPTSVHTGVYKYGTSSADFHGDGFLRTLYNGSSDNFYLGSGDFCLEFWFKTSSQLADLKDKNGALANQIVLTDFSEGEYSNSTKGTGAFEVELSRDRSIKARLYKEDNSVISLGTPTSYYSWNTWNHVAVQRSGKALTLWFNGTTGGGGQRALWDGIESSGKLYDNRSISSGITIGKAAESWQVDSFSGQLEELRYSTQARYTGIFRNYLPTKHFEADSDTRLLMHFDSGNSMFRYVGHGIIDSLTGLTPGNVYFLSPTVSGLYDENESFGIGDISKPVFTALSQETAYVHNYRGIEVTEITDTFYVKMGSPPPTNSTPGQKGMVAYDDHYWYVCVAPNHWKRTAIGDW